MSRQVTKPRLGRPWALALLIGLATGFAVAATMTILDWRLNPGSIFHGDLGTNWEVVVETAASWFSPVTLAAFLVSLAVLAWVKR